MRIGDNEWPLEQRPGCTPVWRGRVPAERLPALAHDVRGCGGQLTALWGSDDRHLGGGFAIHVAFGIPQGTAWVSSDLGAEAPAYPDLSAVFPQADRMQRAAFDLLGIVASGAVDARRWLRHGAWPEDAWPLRRDFDAATRFEPTLDAYPFIQVEGDGVHEIPVGPIHAGTIEPGHFRFSVIGDRILKLEERLGYTHKGIEKRFEGMTAEEGARLAGRVSGDSHVAFAWACCMALESAAGSPPPARAQWLRALFLERERVANHLGDLGYLGNDVAFGIGFMQFWRLKEEWLRLNARLFGHRYLFDRVVPGGVACDLPAGAQAALTDQCDVVAMHVRQLKEIYDEHAGIQDRFVATGIVKPELAARLGLTGLAGRASGQAVDARVDAPCPPYDQVKVAIVTHDHGDVAARAEVRFGEVFESLRLIQELVRRMPAGPLLAELPTAAAGAEGLGRVEGWRGEVLVALRMGADGRLERVHAHDPSWQNWPVMEPGVLGNIVPDFPLINKSFNLSYSGQDL
ncbi:MAG: NADH-quinone oxidoreductase subunit C [Betaproteobacteria bacterium]|nr:NADH-quinone oxidoreductase subunit C [Betaproteobacteria bacterium]